MLTATHSTPTPCGASISGANDDVGKPFRFVVLLARIRSQLRQYDASEDAEFRVGPYTFRPTSKNLVDFAGGEASVDGKGSRDPSLSAPRRSAAGAARNAAQERLGLQRQRHHAHARDDIYRLRQKIGVNPAEAQLLVTEGGAKARGRRARGGRSE